MIYISTFVYRIMVNNKCFYITCVCKNNSYILLQDNYAVNQNVLAYPLIVRIVVEVRNLFSTQQWIDD